jgi:PIN domain nuclease of toxin-antitoxin system
VSLLVGANVFLWFEMGSIRLRPALRKTSARSDERVIVSAASFWEIAIKRRIGKLVLEGSPRAAAAAAGFVELPIDAADAETAGALDWEHRDPFDRMLVAHCLNRAMTLVTADAVLRARSGIAVIWAG